MSASLALALLAACTGGKPMDTAPVATPGDEDGDGWAATGGDCDDGDPDIHPDAEEIPDNETDEDCDGRAFVVPSLADAEVILRGTDEELLAGSSVATGGDIDGDGVGDLLFGAPGGWADAGSQGCAYLMLGPVTSGDATDADATLCAEHAYDTTGGALAFIGDGDGDGYEDLVVAASQSGETRIQAGAVFLFRGPMTGIFGTSDADAILYGNDPGAAVGTSVARLGDADGDGLDDVAVGAPMFDDEGIPGRVLLWFGPQHSMTGEADVILTSDQDLDYAGQSIASAGDVNGDGWVDLLVGAPLSGIDGDLTGKVWLALGPLVTTGALSDTAASFLGVAPRDYAGEGVSSAGDVDGDDRDDLLIGGHLAEMGGPRAGAAWLVVGPETGVHSLADADARFVGEAEHDFAGRYVASGVRDGAPTLLVAAIGDPYGGTATPGTLYLLGADTSTFSPEHASLLRGEHPFDEAGSALSLAGDVTGDDIPDLVVGAPGSDAIGSNTGSVYVIAGEP